MAENERTTVRLAAALQMIPGMPPAMIRSAIDGEYDDYLSDSAFPQAELIADLRVLAAEPSSGPATRAAINALVGQVANGDFDGTSAEADAWAASAEGQAAFSDLLKGR